MTDLDTAIRNALRDAACCDECLNAEDGYRAERALRAVLDECEELDRSCRRVNIRHSVEARRIRRAIARELGIEEES